MRLRCVLLLLLVLVPLAISAEVYKCPDGKGGSALRDVPCSGTITQSPASPMKLLPHDTPVTAAERAAAEQKRQAQAAMAVARRQIWQRPLPQTYAIQIDQALRRMLKDPDSRKIEYVGHPYGSAICGTVNAKNSFGGYTGKQVFLAYFDQSAALAELKIYSDENLVRAQYALEEDLNANLLQRCGVLP